MEEQGAEGGRTADVGHRVRADLVHTREADDDAGVQGTSPRDVRTLRAARGSQGVFSQPGDLLSREFDGINREQVVNGEQLIGPRLHTTLVEDRREKEGTPWVAVRLELMREAPPARAGC